VAYRRDLEAQDLYGEREHLYRAFAGPVRSVLDLPFAHGTLAFNSSEPDAFSEEDIEVLQEFALVLEEGFRRMDDLQKLRQSEERYRTLVQHLPQAIVLMQGNELFFANQALGKITGHSMEELKAMSPQERRQIVHPDDLERVLARYQEPDARKGVPVHMEYRLIGKDGSVHWVESSSQLVQFRDRPVWQILIADIAERKQMEQQLIRLERLEALGEMAGGVNHHLNNILTGVLAPAQLLRQRVEDPEMLVEIDEIVSAARRAADLVRRLGKSAPGGYREAPEVVELNEVARRALEKRPASPNIELIEKWGAVSPVKAQRAALLEGVGQLLVNAAEAMPRGGTITVRTWEDHRGVYLSVADTGKGMDESVRRRVFEPFFSTKGTVDSGLSLSALRSVVASWGGEMEVESAPGKGAVFTVRLPAWKAATPPAEERAGEAPIRILLVEDEEIVRRPVERFLAPTCRVAVAENGRQALEKFKPGEFEVALIDLGLPDLGGDRVALQLQSQDPAMARVLMTGWMLEESDERARAFDFQLAKPFRRMEDLLDMVREATALCRKRRAGT
jgi:PAS domain S-box-containing protein